MSPIKQEVSAILQAALSGQDAALRYNGYIRWGLVESRIHVALDALIAERDALRAELNKGIDAYLAQPACCSGHECGCGGVTVGQNIVGMEMVTKLSNLEAERDALREALELARPYVSAASIRMYDGGQGEGIRQTARDRLVAIDAALQGTTKQELESERDALRKALEPFADLFDGLDNEPEVMTLSTEGARTFVEALLNPRPPSERMQAAYARHQARYRKPNLTCGNCERWHTCNDASYEAVNRPCLVPKEAP